MFPENLELSRWGGEEYKKRKNSAIVASECRPEKPLGMRDTCNWIADEVIFGKEISKSVKCLKKKRFSSLWRRVVNPKRLCFFKKHFTLFDISLPNITSSMFAGNRLPSCDVTDLAMLPPTPPPTPETHSHRWISCVLAPGKGKIKLYYNFIDLNNSIKSKNISVLTNIWIISGCRSASFYSGWVIRNIMILNRAYKEDILEVLQSYKKTFSLDVTVQGLFLM